ncbi:MAG: WD40 repeat domain-containing protein [Isosphaeraceae bacterium]
MRRHPGTAEAMMESTVSPPAAFENSERAPASGIPYVGPRPFERCEQGRFFGRNREALDLMYLILAHPAVLLYAESGAGKSSLVNAKLIPMLEGEGCHVLPVARVRGTTHGLEPDDIDNIFVFHALESWTGLLQPEDAVRLSKATVPDELARISDRLAKLSGELNRGYDEPPQIVAIIDQFEELFTHYGHRWDERRGLFEQIAAALVALPNLHVLFAMREDYSAGMDSFAAILPEKLRTRYRLEHLNRKSALEAIRRPMEDAGRKFADGVAERLVDDLMKIRVARSTTRAGGESIDGDLAATYGQTPPGTSTSEMLAYNPKAHSETEEYVQGESVMPVQLQVVCQTLWEGLRPEETTVTLQHLEKCGDIDGALSGFYERCVDEAAGTVGLGEGKLRRWFEDKLITRMGTRRVVMRDPEQNQTEGLPNEAVDVLDERHIIHGEDKDGVRWYELTHDRFIAPIRDANRRWRSTRSADTLEALERQATAWFQALDADKASHLLNAEDLGKAEVWITGTDAADLGYSETLAEFLKEGRRSLTKAVEMTERRVLIRSSIILGVAVLVAIVGWFQSYMKGWEAGVFVTTNDALYQAEQNPQAGLQRAVEAADKISGSWLPIGKSASDKTTQALRHILVRTRQRLVIDGGTTELTDLDFHPDGRHVALLGQDGSAQLWDIGIADDATDDLLIDTLPADVEPNSSTRLNVRVNHITFNATGNLLVVVCGNPAKPLDKGTARIWRPKGFGHERTVTLLTDGHTGPVTEAAFSPDQRFLATASVQRKKGGLLQVFDMKASMLAKTGKPACRALLLDEMANCVSFGPENQLCVASGNLESDERGAKGGVEIYRLVSEDPEAPLHLVTEMKDYDGPVSHAVFSLDGQLVAAGCRDGAIRVFRADNGGEIVATLLGHTKPVVSLVFSADGSRLVTASYDRTARVWEAGRWLANPGREWSCNATLSGHKSDLFHTEFSPDGSLVLTCSYDKTVRLWDAGTGERLVIFPGHKGPVYTARFSMDGRLIGTVSADKSARIWDVGQVESPQHLLSGHDAAVRDVAIDPEGRWTLTASADGTSKLWDLKDGTLARTFRGHTGPLTAAAFAPGSALVATASLDGTVRLWSCKGKTNAKPITLNVRSAALGVTFSPTGRFLLTSWADGQMRLYARDPNWTQVGPPWPGSARRLSPHLFADDDSVLVTPNIGLLQIKGNKGSVKIWDLSETTNSDQGKVKELHTWRTELPVADVAFGTDANGGGDLIAAALTDGLRGGAVRLWSWRDNPALQIGKDLPHDVGVERVVLRRDGRELVSESEGGTGLVWSLPLPTNGETPKPKKRLPGLTGPVPNLAYSPDGTQLASDGGRLATDTGDGPVQVWNRPANPHPPVVFRGQRTSILALAFALDDPKQILTVDRENRFQRWQIDTGSPLEQHRGPDFPATTSAISPDGQSVLTGASDGSAQLWKVMTNEKKVMTNEKFVLKGHTDQISAAAFSPDGALVVTASWDKTVRIWRARDDGPNKAGQPVGGPIDLGDFVNSVRFHPDQSRRLLVTATGDLTRERVQSKKPNPENKALVAYLVRPNTLEAEPIFQTPKAAKTSTDLAKEYFGVNATLCSPDGHRVYLACGGQGPADCVVKVYDVVDGRLVGKPKVLGQPDDNGHTEPILALDLSPDGTSLVTTSADNTACLWDLKKNRLIGKLSEHSGDVVSASFSPDSKFVVTLSLQDGTARIWDAATSERISVIATRRSGVNSAALGILLGPRSFTDDVAAAVFSPDGTRLITANGDGNARIYQLELCGNLEELRAVAKRRTLDPGHAPSIQSP